MNTPSYDSGGPAPRGDLVGAPISQWMWPLGDPGWRAPKQLVAKLKAAIDSCPPDMSVVVRLPEYAGHAQGFLEIYPDAGWVRTTHTDAHPIARIAREPGDGPVDPDPTLGTVGSHLDTIHRVPWRIADLFR